MKKNKKEVIAVFSIGVLFLIVAIMVLYSNEQPKNVGIGVSEDSIIGETPIMEHGMLPPKETNEPTAYLDYFSDEEMEKMYGYNENILSYAKDVIGTILPNLIVLGGDNEIKVHELEGSSMVYIHATWCESCVESLKDIENIIKERDLKQELFLIPVMETYEEALSKYRDLGLSIEPHQVVNNFESDLEIPAVPLYFQVEEGVIVDLHIGSVPKEKL